MSEQLDVGYILHYLGNKNFQNNLSVEDKIFSQNENTVLTPAFTTLL